MTVLLNSSPLHNANSIRGVGVYTRFLSDALESLQTQQDQFITGDDIGLDQLNAIMAKRGIDIMHYPFFDLFLHTLPLPIEQKILGKSKQKVVVTIHDVIPLLYPDHYPVGIKGSFHFFLQKQALKSVDAIITDSQTSKADIVKHLSMNEEKVTSIPLAGNPQLQKSDAATIAKVRSHFQLPKHFVLYVGDINYNKNIPALIQAVQSIDQNVHLVCVGRNFYPQHIPEWQAIEAVLEPVKDRVHFLTKIAKDDTQTLSALYSTCAVYVQPSLYEGFGLPLLEAMQCDALIVSSNTPALTEIGGEGVLFVKPSTSELAQGIKKTLSYTEQKKHQLKAKNHETVQHFSWHKTALQTIQVYKSVL